MDAGFIPALLATITQKYILSPSATIFTSEIPSNFTTPLPTGGTNTPANAGQPGPVLHPAAHGVNPLLVAATHANNPNLNAGTPSTVVPNAPPYHRSTGHSQTPTSVKVLKPPEYFPEWKDHGNSNAPGTMAGTNNQPGPSNTAAAPSTGSHHGMEEATFLGAQVAAKVIFVLDQGLSKGFMNRVEYNESGPAAIHEYVL